MGGYDGGNTLSSTETWSPGDSSWTTVSPLPRAVSWGEAASLNNMIYLIGEYLKALKLRWRFFISIAGNYDIGEGGLTSDADNVYEWNGDEEEWTVHGTILERRSNVGSFSRPRVLRGLGPLHNIINIWQYLLGNKIFFRKNVKLELEIACQLSNINASLNIIHGVRTMDTFWI